MPDRDARSVPRGRASVTHRNADVVAHTGASRRFGIAAVVATIGAALVYVALILTEAGQRFENLALMGARREVETVKEESLAELSGISAVGFAVAIGIVILVALLRRKPLLAAVAALIMGISVVIAEVAKRALQRPDLVDAPERWLNNSFPSGHMAIAVAIGVGAVIVAPYALRWLVTILGAGYAMGIGLAVETAGWHRLSGVLGATLLVLAVAGFGLYLLARSGRVRPFASRRLSGALVATVILGGAALVFLGAGLVGVARLQPLSRDPDSSEMLLAFTSTHLLGVGFIALAFLLFLWLIRPFSLDESPASDKKSSPATT